MSVIQTVYEDTIKELCKRGHDIEISREMIKNSNLLDKASEKYAMMWIRDTDEKDWADMVEAQYKNDNYEKLRKSA